MGVRAGQKAGMRQLNRKRHDSFIQIQEQQLYPRCTGLEGSCVVGGEKLAVCGVVSHTLIRQGRGFTLFWRQGGDWRGYSQPGQHYLPLAL